MHWVAKVMLATTLALMASGCAGDSPKATPTPGATATSPTSEPTRVPPTVDPNSKSPTSGSPPITYPPSRAKPSVADQATLATDPLVVYADEVASSDFNGRGWPVVEVVSYNLRTGRIAGLLRVGEVGEYASTGSMQLVGRSVVIDLEKRLVVANLDGTGMRTLFSAPAGGVITSFAVSPDGKTVAVGTESADLRAISGLSFLVFLDVRSGAELRRIDLPAFQALGPFASPGILGWTSGTSVGVFGASHKGGSGFAKGGQGNALNLVAGLDGSVRSAVLLSDFVGIGRPYAESFDERDLNPECGSAFFPRKLTITQIASGMTIGSIAPEGRVVEFRQWSADGVTLLYSTLPLLAGGQCADRGAVHRWHTWSSSGIQDVPDLRQLLQNWDGPRFIDLICNGAPIPMLYPLYPRGLACDVSASPPPATLVIGGKPIDVIHRAAVVGFVE